MPSIEAPTHYDHSKGIEPQPHDDFFRWASANSYLSETGEADSPLGWVCLLEVDREMVDSYIEETGDKSFYPEVGWYVVRQDDRGFIWAMIYGTGTLAEEGARADFTEAEKVYDEWLNINSTDV